MVMANKPNPWDRAKTGTEHAEQSALIMWANMAANFGIAAADDPRSYQGEALALYGPFRGPQAVPALARLFAIHNQGHGDAKRGATAKAEGVKAGVPDLMLPYPVVCKEAEGLYVGNGHGIFCGLFIELKRLKSDRGAKGRAADKQNDWLDFLKDQGYQGEVCFGWLEGRACILKYLGLES